MQYCYVQLSISFSYRSVSIRGLGQFSLSDLKSQEVCWLGLDFSQARMIGSNGFTEKEKVSGEYLSEWNQFFYEEESKYDIAEAFRLKKLNMNTDACAKRNEAINKANFIRDSRYFLTEKMVAEAVESFNYNGIKESIGILFLVESFSKSDERATVWVVLIDIAKKSPFLVKEMTGVPRGIGIVNYWGGSIYDIIVQIRDKYYRLWLDNEKGK